ncbi:MAG TPA: amidohydrolase family protein [Acidimicrobiia bacterium]|nr:amidohydrolase family protein [Acidimicrobiia bacterium]
MSNPVIDLHAHRECAPAMEMMKSEAERAGRLPLAGGSELTREVNRRQRRDLQPKMASIDVRLADMDRMGVDMQVVSISPYQIYTWAAPDLAEEVSRLSNDDLADAIAPHSDRFIGLGTVPVQDCGRAVAELERCLDQLAFKGVELTTNIEGEDLSSPRLEPFWVRAEELGAVLFLHSAGFTHPERLADHYFINILGHPIEGTLAAAHLIFGGVLERHPDLKVVMAHGGGYLAAYPGRIDHAYRARADVQDGLPRPPGDYLRRFYLDTVVFEPDQLGFLINRYGADHIVLGTDYPYDMGEPDPLALLAKVPGLGEGEVAAIRGGNAAALLDLS